MSAAMHLAPPPPVLGYGSVGRGWYSAQQQHQGTNARMYGLQPISSSLPNPSASGLRMHNYVIRAGGRLFRLFLGWLSSSSLTPTRAQYIISMWTWTGWNRVMWMRRRGGGLVVFGRCREYGGRNSSGTRLKGVLGRMSRLKYNHRNNRDAF